MNPSGSTVSQRVIAAGVVLAFLYVASTMVMTVVIAALFASTLEPAVKLLSQRGLPRALAASIMVLVLLGGFYLFFYLFYAQGATFIDNLPKFADKLREHVMKFRAKTQEIERQTKAVIEVPAEGPHLPPSQQGPDLTSFLGAGLRSVTEILVMASFVPFLIYFMLTWKSHLRRNLIAMFDTDQRMSAERMLDGITLMINGFVVGNAIIGLLLSVASALFFWGMQLPYPVILGPMSGFLSLVPYFGAVLAILPPAMAGIVHYQTIGPVVVLVAGVMLLHLLALNLLYPKIVGRRTHLNPVVVTLSLMFWGWLWGGMGLILAVPITAGLKAICDNVIALRPYGRFLGD